MTYKAEILDIIDTINQVLLRLNKPTIFENPDFSIDEMSMEFYLKLNFAKKESIHFNIKISLHDIQIGIDRIDEAFTWSTNALEHDKKEIDNLIEQLFTSTIKVEYCGSNYTKLYLLNSIGECSKTLKYVTGLYLKINCQTREYKPVYIK